MEGNPVITKNGAELKPVIYLYPEKQMNISVKLNYKGDLLYTYPIYEGGWNVTTYPNGDIIHNGKEYSYLFWEGYSGKNWNIDEGFIVEGKDIVPFLQEKLGYMGLTPKEYNEFIAFWMPILQDNEYNQICFSFD